MREHSPYCSYRGISPEECPVCRDPPAEPLDASGLLATEAVDLWNAINYWSGSTSTEKRESVGTRVNRIIRGAIDRAREEGRGDTAALVGALRSVTDRLQSYEADYGPGYDPPVIPLAREALARLGPGHAV